mmetsp:Transcript_9011/g.28495  ORF Transcript_9011/g.28495 Transcript_9011/m.28495 type:complete len:265 (+) Transcript_9011:197-991(+)
MRLQRHTLLRLSRFCRAPDRVEHDGEDHGVVVGTDQPPNDGRHLGDREGGILRERRKTRREGVEGPQPDGQARPRLWVRARPAEFRVCQPARCHRDLRRSERAPLANRRAGVGQAQEGGPGRGGVCRLQPRPSGPNGQDAVRLCAQRDRTAAHGARAAGCLPRAALRSAHPRRLGMAADPAQDARGCGHGLRHGRVDSPGRHADALDAAACSQEAVSTPWLPRRHHRRRRKLHRRRRWPERLREDQEAEGRWRAGPERHPLDRS